ncbi:hypothetical protein MRX96_007389 [Rhipicephalus microplus]
MRYAQVYPGVRKKQKEEKRGDYTRRGGRQAGGKKAKKCSLEKRDLLPDYGFFFYIFRFLRIYVAAS